MQASGEQLPFADASFDVVFCDHGALSFCDPEVSVPEVARLLRPGGLLAFCCTHPMLYLTWDDKNETQTRKLQIDYADLGRLALEEGTDRLGVAAGRMDPRAARQRVRDRGSPRAAGRLGRVDVVRRLRAAQVGAALARRVDLEGAPALRPRALGRPDQRTTSDASSAL